ncbi:DNA/RNA nuclease SfsA [[Clostridium] polysaccharolyticum]|uniref:Sugar fermentation stimulation protein homolog n=1 Tax=[Clostridium] polysaccharolyticum TaxID=29364 RepID=A0A1I0C6H9_9FIRM|nr:DNA/RNA nuclease SfsA [[Clostridium] polysaccharolyticum]SET15105.1 sugar fermentation stimulation protein A [[Clostridium] polysaccharolyticum]
MRYKNIKKGRFLGRPNRFIAHVDLNGEEAVCHVKNTGRCKELLIPGESVVYIEDHGEDARRKTRYSLIGVEKGNLMINMDSQAPNKVVKEWIAQGGFLPGITLIKPEKKYGDSRFDFYLEQGDKKIFMEVKGVTLEENGVAMFPDAPTERGIKHMEELITCKENGYDAYILFVVQMAGMKVFKPNDRTHPAFGEALRKAKKHGVEILVKDCLVKEDELKIAGTLPFEL